MVKIPKEHPEKREAREAMLNLRANMGEHFEAGFIITTCEIDGETHYFHASVHELETKYWMQSTKPYKIK